MPGEIRAHWLKFLPLIALIAVLLSVAYLLLPLLDGIVLGLVFAYVARPLKNQLVSRVKNSERIAALLATAALVVPIVAIFVLGIIEAARQLAWIIQNQDVVAVDLNRGLATIGLSPDLTDSIINAAQSTVSTVPVSRYLTYSATANVGIFLLNLVLSVIICYYLLVDGKRFVRSLLALYPQTDASRRFVHATDRMISGIYVGNFLAAVLISLISIPVFFVFRIPLIAVLAALMFIAALVPILAEWMVLLPVASYVFLVRGPFEAGIFLIVGVIILYVIPELILRPYLVGKASSIHPLLILLSFLGGGIVGGLAGFFLGPIAVGVILAAYSVYKGDRKALRQDEDSTIHIEDGHG
ncbi:MAG: AI-2E family transporter [Euryarchaeota archaeon]|nr:AI-2E family transporter [Euryarchaeota archaeon]